MNNGEYKKPANAKKMKVKRNKERSKIKKVFREYAIN